MKQTLLTTIDDINWLIDTWFQTEPVIKFFKGSVKTAMIFGDESSPSEIHLYAYENPHLDYPYLKCKNVDDNSYWEFSIERPTKRAGK